MCNIYDETLPTFSKETQQVVVFAFNAPKHIRLTSMMMM